MNIEIANLRDKAICVRLTRRMYNPYKYDAVATEAAQAGNGTSKAGRFNKRLLRGSVALKEAMNASAKVYEYVVDHTLPWMDEGVRVLPNTEYFEFCEAVRQRRATYEAALQRLYDAWDADIMKDKAALNGMWNINDYPDKDRMLEKWGMSLTFSPVPSSDDFRIDMDAADKAALDEAVEKVQAQAGDYLLREILKPVAAMVEKLAVPIGQEGSVFRDTLVSNVKDVIARAKKLNINNDARVDSVISDLEKVTSLITPETLRTSDVVREATQKATARVAEKINQWF